MNFATVLSKQFVKAVVGVGLIAGVVSIACANEDVGSSLQWQHGPKNSAQGVLFLERDPERRCLGY